MTSGIGAALLLNLRSKGTFDGRGIMLAPDAEVREVSGAYRCGRFLWRPAAVASNLQVLQGAETLVGQGASQPDGHIVLELASGRKQVRSRRGCCCRCIQTRRRPGRRNW